MSLLEAIQHSNGCSEDMRALMQKDDIVSQLVHMLSSENSQVQSRGASTLSNFAQYGEHKLAWKPLSLLMVV